MGIHEFFFFSKGGLRSCIPVLSDEFPDGYTLLWQTAEAWILLEINSGGDLKKAVFGKERDPLH